ncbi:hypothetical protein [Peromfec virus RodF8_20]|uniref:Uncharacterized protein n=1 Tax=Peromfec virus RodF8_20 TaxID=2929362 RepID=A0A976N358_9VIRU|nr:hypothetical protein [Peromfec virus RodF8_20]
MESSQNIYSRFSPATNRRYTDYDALAKQIKKHYSYSYPPYCAFLGYSPAELPRPLFKEFCVRFVRYYVSAYRSSFGICAVLQAVADALFISYSAARSAYYRGHALQSSDLDSK